MPFARGIRLRGSEADASGTAVGLAIGLAVGLVNLAIGLAVMCIIGSTVDLTSLMLNSIGSF